MSKMIHAHTHMLVCMHISIHVHISTYTYVSAPLHADWTEEQKAANPDAAGVPIIKLSPYVSSMAHIRVFVCVHTRTRVFGFYFNARCLAAGFLSVLHTIWMNASGCFVFVQFFNILKTKRAGEKVLAGTCMPACVAIRGWMLAFICGLCGHVLSQALWWVCMCESAKPHATFCAYVCPHTFVCARVSTYISVCMHVCVYMSWPDLYQERYTDHFHLPPLI
jgi:hypothetical protein